MNTDHRAAPFRAALLLALWPVGAVLADPPPPSPAAEAAHQVVREHAGSPVLDPAIFVEISPVTVSEPAIRLPPDQQESH